MPDRREQIKAGAREIEGVANKQVVWRAEKVHATSFWAVCRDDLKYGHVCVATEIEHEFEARLIAAAPDMLNEIRDAIQGNSGWRARLKSLVADLEAPTP